MRGLRDEFGEDDGFGALVDQKSTHVEYLITRQLIEAR